MKIVAYRVVSAIDPRQLNEGVAALMLEGWVPFGGVSSGSEDVLAQAMVKYE